MFRGTEADGYPILSLSFKISLLSCAALSHPPLCGQKYAKPADASLMRRKVQIIVDGALRAKCDVAVLGAFGCGAFCNPPELVAQMFQDVLQTSPLKEAVFCIIDDHNTNQCHNPRGNFLPFKEVFDKMPKNLRHLSTVSGEASGSSLDARSQAASAHSGERSYNSLPHLNRSTAQMVSSEPTVYASLLQKFDSERAVMYYGLHLSEFRLVSVCTHPCRKGLQNGSRENNCFINAALHCFLRLDIVAKMLRVHKARHEERRRRNGAGCAACELADLAAAMRNGTLASASRFVSMVRRGDFGHDFRSYSVQTRHGVHNEHPQCDAPELFFGPETQGDRQPEYLGFMGVLNRWEECGFWGGADVIEARDVNEVHQSRHVLDTCVFGVLLRTRKRCMQCNYVTDSLQEDPFLALAFRQGESQPTISVSLVTMVQRELGECVTDSSSKCGRREQNGCTGQGSADIVIQRYIEREPPVLVIRLRRVWRDESGTRKMHARCQFPEVLTFMRTGEYHFAGVILHGGSSTTSGHYRAVTWHDDDRYWLYDDDKDVKPLSWSDLEDAAIQSQCYMLIYVRTRLWNGVCADGSEHTPYLRDASSLRYVLQADSGAGGASSNHTRGSGVDPTRNTPHISLQELSSDAEAKPVASLDDCSRRKRLEPEPRCLQRNLSLGIADVSLSDIQEVSARRPNAKARPTDSGASSRESGDRSCRRQSARIAARLQPEARCLD